LLRALVYALVLSTSLAHAEARPVSSLERVARELGAAEGKYFVDELNMVPMRDGVRLSTAVIRPAAGGPHPVILVRTPYAMFQEANESFFRTLFANDYAVVLQNERGTHWSEGTFHFLGRAREDGYDTLTWIARQSWSNGRVGTYGCSSSGENQLALATMRHPAHKAMVAMSAGAGIGNIPGVSSQGLFYRGGVPHYAAWASWYGEYGHAVRPVMPAGLSADDTMRVALTYDPEKGRWQGADFHAAMSASLQGFPSRDVLRRLGLPPTDFDTFITRAPADPAWDALGLIGERDTGAIPALHVNAWGDIAPYETMKLFEFQQHHPEQYLIMAPTAHCEMLKATEATMVGERAMGDARLPYEQIFLQWFDRHLKGTRNTRAMPTVRIFLMGAGGWIGAPRWPVPDTRLRNLYLHSNGRANSRFGDGLLSFEPPSKRQTPDSLPSDPAVAVPSNGGGCCDRRVFRDQSAVESRHDVLVYSTDPFEDGLAVLGEVDAVLYVAAAAPDADIAMKLVDVYPDGRAFNLSDTILRLRYRDGFDEPKALVPGQVYRVEVKGLITGNDFRPGHRLRVEIAGSNFPNHERNLHNGWRNYEETEPRATVTTIYHDGDRASHLMLRVYSGRQLASLRGSHSL